MSLTDLASRRLGGSVVSANDETFADRANLISPGDAGWDPTAYGPYGKTYDGWETRRRREAGHDHAIVRLGAAGIVRSVVVDTSWFRGNFPPYGSVEAVACEGYPSAAELADAGWQTLLPRSELKGDAKNAFDVHDERRWTHVRLSIYPDGGVARFRVLGEVVPDPRLLTGTVDLAALESGGDVEACSDMFYSSAQNLVSPGSAATMADGWETRRRRDDGNDWVLFRLAGAGRLRVAELDTTMFVGNAPGAARLLGTDARQHAIGPDLSAAAGWVELLPRSPLRPDTRHRFRLRGTPSVTHVRLDAYPDGGMSRVRLLGELDPSAAENLAARWFNALPDAHCAAVLAAAGESASRPVAAADLPPALREHLLG